MCKHFWYPLYMCLLFTATVLCDTAPRTLVGTFQIFGSTCCLRSCSPTLNIKFGGSYESWVLYELHGVTCHKP